MQIHMQIGRNIDFTYADTEVSGPNCRVTREQYLSASLTSGQTSSSSEDEIKMRDYMRCREQGELSAIAAPRVE